MCYWLLPISGIPIVHSTVQSLSGEQKPQPDVLQELSELNAAILDKIGTPSDKDNICNYNIDDPDL
jgi:hypothetical protein